MASGITLLSLQLFWFPLALAAQLGCSAYIWGVSIVLVSGILCHGSDWWYRPVRGERHETVIALAWLDRSCVFAAILFFSTASFSVSISWLAAFLCISAAGFIYVLLVPGRNGELWHTALHLAEPALEAAGLPALDPFAGPAPGDRVGALEVREPAFDLPADGGGEPKVLRLRLGRELHRDPAVPDGGALEARVGGPGDEPAPVDGPAEPVELGKILFGHERGSDDPGNLEGLVLAVALVPEQLELQEAVDLFGLVLGSPREHPQREVAKHGVVLGVDTLMDQQGPVLPPPLEPVHARDPHLGHPEDRGGGDRELAKLEASAQVLRDRAVQAGDLDGLDRGSPDGELEARVGPLDPPLPGLRGREHVPGDGGDEQDPGDALKALAVLRDEDELGVPLELELAAVERGVGEDGAAARLWVPLDPDLDDLGAETELDQGHCGPGRGGRL